MVERENETLRERVVDLERRLHDQNDEVTCLRATLADALRRISSLEAGKGGWVNWQATRCTVEPSWLCQDILLYGDFLLQRICGKLSI